jgi:hypothetical protein
LASSVACSCSSAHRRRATQHPTMSKTTATVTPINDINEAPDVAVDVKAVTTPLEQPSQLETKTTKETEELMDVPGPLPVQPTKIPKDKHHFKNHRTQSGRFIPKERLGSTASDASGVSTIHGIRRMPSKLEAEDNSESKIRMKCAHNMLEQTWFVTLTTVLTLYALFGDDFRLATSDKPADIVFYVFSLLALIVFVVELIITSLGQPYYFEFGYSKTNGFLLPSFYFWLDVAATVSLYPDVVPLFVQEDPYSVPPSADAVKAGRASRAGTRAGRIIRLVRIVRMVKLVKAVRGKEVDKIEETKDAPSAVGTKLSEVTIRKIIMIVLLSIIVLPILDGSLEGAENLQHVYGLQELHRVPMDRNTSGDIPGNVFAERVRQYGRDVGKVVHVQVSTLSYDGCLLKCFPKKLFCVPTLVLFCCFLLFFVVFFLFLSFG